MVNGKKEIPGWEVCIILMCGLKKRQTNKKRKQANRLLYTSMSVFSLVDFV